MQNITMIIEALKSVARFITVSSGETGTMAHWFVCTADKGINHDAHNGARGFEQVAAIRNRIINDLVHVVVLIGNYLCQ